MLLNERYNSKSLWHLPSLMILNGCLIIKPRTSQTKFTAYRTAMYLLPRKGSIPTALLLRLSSALSSTLFSVDLLAYQASTSPSSTYLLDIFYQFNQSAYFITVRLCSGRGVNSLDKFFFNYWWSEREASEHYGLFFSSKVDSRNLLLDYTWSLNPMLRLFPSVGFVEVFFDSLQGRMFHQKISYQV